MIVLGPFKRHWINFHGTLVWNLANCHLFHCILFFSVVVFVQLRNRVKQEQHVRLQQQKDALNKKNQEVAVMERRLAELRQRLWKKKNALQQKDNLPVRQRGGFFITLNCRNINTLLISHI